MFLLSIRSGAAKTEPSSDDKGGDAHGVVEPHGEGARTRDAAEPQDEVEADKPTPKGNGIKRKIKKTKKKLTITTETTTAPDTDPAEVFIAACGCSAIRGRS